MHPPGPLTSSVENARTRPRRPDAPCPDRHRCVYAQISLETRSDKATVRAAQRKSLLLRPIGRMRRIYRRAVTEAIQTLDHDGPSMSSSVNFGAPPVHAIPGCSRPASRPGRSGAPPRAAALAHHPMRSTCPQNRRAPSCIMRLEGRTGEGYLRSWWRGTFVTGQRVAEKRVPTRSQRLASRSPLHSHAAMNKSG